MHLFQNFRDAILAHTKTLIAEGTLPEGLPLGAINAEPPREATHGDVATNVAMVLAKPAGQNPRELAQKFADFLKTHPDVAELNIAGPGFINLTLKPHVWARMIRHILAVGRTYGESTIGNMERVNVEYVSANPTGPMHIGHARGAVVGDVIAELLAKVGYAVTKEFYINDAGSQIDALTRSAFLRYREALGEDIGEIPEGHYPGEYLIPVGQELTELHGNRLLSMDEAEWFPLVRKVTLDSMLNLIKRDLADLGVVHDVFTSEASLAAAKMVDDCQTELEQRGLIYQGVLEPPKGKTPEDWEPREQTLFRATNFGDDVDRPLRKSDGSPTYFAADIAYHHDKIRRGYNKMVLELGADHGGYVKRMKAAVKALSNGTASIEIILHQLVNFMENGEPMKMSKRSGTFTTVRDVVDALDAGSIRFTMLTRKADAVLDFDLAKAKEQSKDNPVFYVQYAHARAASLLRQAAETLPEAVQQLDETVSDAILARLSHEGEREMLRQLANWPRILESAALKHEPHRIAFALQEIAASFHSLWNMGKDDASLRFIVEDDPQLTQARYVLVQAVKHTIASGLDIMGISPVERM